MHRWLRSRSADVRLRSENGGVLHRVSECNAPCSCKRAEEAYCSHVCPKVNAGIWIAHPVHTRNRCTIHWTHFLCITTAYRQLCTLRVPSWTFREQYHDLMPNPVIVVRQIGQHRTCSAITVLQHGIHGPFAFKRSRAKRTGLVNLEPIIVPR